MQGSFVLFLQTIKLTASAEVGGGLGTECGVNLAGVMLG